MNDWLQSLIWFTWLIIFIRWQPIRAVCLAVDVFLIGLYSALLMNEGKACNLSCELIKLCVVGHMSWLARVWHGGIFQRAPERLITHMNTHSIRPPAKLHLHFSSLLVISFEGLVFALLLIRSFFVFDGKSHDC